MKITKENLRNDIKKAVNNKSWNGSVEDEVKKLFKEKMKDVIADVSESLNKRDPGYSRTIRSLMELQCEINEL